MDKYSIDRIEDGTAVCESMDGIHIYISADDLPEGAKEGSVIVRDEDGIRLLPEETEKVREELFDLAESLFSDDA